MKNCWFRNTPLGIFVHWGVYSAIGRGEWVLNQERMPLAEYDSHIPEFTAEKYDPEEWAAEAKNAGAEYMVLTAKHHDGFCLFRTETTHRNAFEQGPKRDLVRLFAEACRKHGLKVGFYFSPPDWTQPAYNDGPEKDPAAWKKYVDGLQTQLRELMSNYGKVDLLWYDRSCNLSGKDTLTAENMRSAELNAMVRSLQPGILINDRSGLPEDFHTAEQNMRAPEDPERMWEGCITMNRHWGCFPADPYYKTPFEILMTMSGVASAGGHLMLNVGPDAGGRMNRQEISVLRAIGEWMKVNSESLRGTKRITLSGGTYGCASQKDDCVYLYIHWPHSGGRIVIPECKERFAEARLLRGNLPLQMNFDGNRLILSGLPLPSKGDLPVVKLLRKHHA